MNRGTYALTVEANGEILVGKLGRFSFHGLYVYVGSALGAGGLVRVERHLAVCEGRVRTRRWHIDYLLGLGELKAVYVREGLNPNQECALARRLSQCMEPAAQGFGSSDCGCRTHLFRVPEGDPDRIRSSLTSLGYERRPSCAGDAQ